MTDVAVLGAGAFGTALAVSLARAGRRVALVARDAEQAAKLAEAGENATRLPGVRFPAGLQPQAQLPEAPVILAAIPTQAVRGALTPLAARLEGRLLVACNKGIDLKQGLGPAALLQSIVPSARVGILSGPGFAADIAAGLPTALTIAARDPDHAARMQRTLSTPDLRLYRSTDVIGVELGGALKNVIAIACGLVMGAGLGESARAALLTRGFAELSRFALSRGARAETLSGLSGLGDLVLTATSEKSRNYAHGLRLGRGEAGARGTTVEGVVTAKAVSDIAKKAGIDMPVVTLVDAVLDGRMTIEAAREAVLSRPLKEE